LKESVIVLHRVCTRRDRKWDHTA